jgi:proline iminopeptidase
LRGEERERYNLELMFPDPRVDARIDSVNAARGVRNTGELSRGLFRGGLLRHHVARLDRLTMPVLVVAGRHDGAARPEGLRELARRLPNARFVEYERSGHFVYLDEPERFAREVSAFVRSR